MRLTLPITRESQVLNHVIRYLWLLEQQGKILAYRTSSGAIKTESGRFFRTGRTGCPDVTACLRGGRYLAIEVKSTRGRQSEGQIAFEQRLKSLGGLYVIVRSIDDVQKKIVPLIDS